jgi:hypothetical protein
MKAGWIEFGAGFSSLCAAKSFAAQICIGDIRSIDNSNRAFL